MASDDRRRRRVVKCNGQAARSDRPWIAYVLRSNRKCEVQVWSRAEGRVVAGMSSAGLAGAWNCEGAKELGRVFGSKLIQLGVREIHFNRRGYAYHGRVAAIADGLRETGIIC